MRPGAPVFWKLHPTGQNPVVTERCDLDHIALAFEHAWDGFDRYCGDLGGEFIGGGPDPGFSWHQLRFSNGMRLELLEPANVEEFDFLRRFLDRHGPGPHHATFKVPDIDEAIARASAAGYEPVRVNLDHDQWKEAFLHPKQSHGIVIQLAWAEEHDHPQTTGLPAARTANRAALERATLLVTDLDAARGLFAGVLDGQVSSEGDDDLGRFVEMAWPGPGRIRLVEPAPGPPVAWLGDRPGRLHHLAFRARRAVDGAEPLGNGTWEVAAERNFGTRLRISTGPGVEAVSAKP